MTTEMQAANLAHQLERLLAMRRAATRLMARDTLGRNFFQRGQPEPMNKNKVIRHHGTLLDLLKAYARALNRNPTEY